MLPSIESLTLVLCSFFLDWMPVLRDRMSPAVPLQRCRSTRVPVIAEATVLSADSPWRHKSNRCSIWLVVKRKMSVRFLSELHASMQVSYFLDSRVLLHFIPSNFFASDTFKFYFAACLVSTSGVAHLPVILSHTARG